MTSATTTTTEPADRDYRSALALADRYGVDEMTVRRWAAAGLFPAYKIGPWLIRYDLAEVEAALVREMPTARTAK